MKEIQLTQGKVALVDDDDFDHLNQFTWNAQKIHNNWYACRSVWTPKRKGISMHRQLMNIWDGKVLVDHVNKNGLDNRKSNLRLCTASQNCSNKRSYTGSSSRFLGVTYVKKRKKWRAAIHKGEVKKFLGEYMIEEDAALAYNNAAKIFHGEFANLNIIP